MADCAASGESVHVDADRLRVSAPAAGSPARATRASAGALQASLSRFSALHTPLSCPTSKAKVIFEGHKATSCFRHFNSSHHAQSHPASPYLSLQGPRTSGHSLPLHLLSHQPFSGSLGSSQGPLSLSWTCHSFPPQGLGPCCPFRLD